MVGGMAAPPSPARRRALGLILGCASAPAFAALPAFPASTRYLELASLHTGEVMGAAYRRAGELVSDALLGFQHLLRDHRTGAAHPIDARLFDLLADLADAARVEPRFQIISGYRSPQTNSVLASRSEGVATRSLHMQGQAIDVRLPGCDTQRLSALARKLGRGGVGYYNRSDFVHVDTGRVRHWAG